MKNDSKIQALAVLLLSAVASLAVAFGQSSQARTAVPDRDAMRKILAKGHENREKKRKFKEDDPARGALDDALRPILAAARLGLQEITPARGDRIGFTRSVLNSTGAGFDAVRFRTPDTGEAFTLRVEIVVPGSDETRNIQEWNLSSLDGPSPYIDNFSRRDNFELPGSGFPEENFTITPYVQGPAPRPGAEYFLWFDLRSDQVTPAFVKIALLPGNEPPLVSRTTTLARARTAFNTAMKGVNQRYDTEMRALRKGYLTVLDRAKAATSTTDAQEADRIDAEVAELNRRDPDMPARRGFRILSAQYGIDTRWVDVTDDLRPLVRGNVLRCGLGLDFAFKQDPAFGVLKRLVIVYSLDGNIGVSITGDKQRIELPPTMPILDRIPPMNSHRP